MTKKWSIGEIRKDPRARKQRIYHYGAMLDDAKAQRVLLSLLSRNTQWKPSHTEHNKLQQNPQMENVISIVPLIKEAS